MDVSLLALVLQMLHDIAPISVIWAGQTKIISTTGPPLFEPPVFALLSLKKIRKLVRPGKVWAVSSAAL